MAEAVWRWSPEPWWVAVGGFAGAVWGGVAGALWLGLVSWGESWEDMSSIAWFFLGGAFGAMIGSATGLGTGVVLALVVGRDRPIRTARPLAAVTALLAAAVMLVAVLQVTSGATLIDVLGLARLVVLTGVAAAGTSWWFAPRMAGRPRVVRSG